MVIHRIYRNLFGREATSAEMGKATAFLADQQHVPVAPDVAAGPAGVRAAETLAASGLHTLVVDEAARAGGKINRRPPDGFSRPPKALYGFEAA